VNKSQHATPQNKANPATTRTNTVVLADGYKVLEIGNRSKGRRDVSLFRRNHPCQVQTLPRFGL